MFRTLISKRCASTGPSQGSSHLAIPRRPARKIRLGKARPAIYHQFDVLVELSDGSVIKRRSQFPKNEIRLIQDQRNNPLWNPSRTDLMVVDANASGKVDRFKQRYSSIFSMQDEVTAQNAKDEGSQSSAPKNEAEGDSHAEPQEEFGMDDYLSLLDDNTRQIKTGKLATKKKDKK